MESAGAEVARVALEMLSGIPYPKIHIFCGPGNNGGDGFVAARHLINRGAQVWVYTTKNQDRYLNDSLISLNVLKNMGIETITLDEKLVPQLPLSGDLIIDALLGTGTQGPLKEPIHSLIHHVNNSGLAVLSVDLVSGQDGNMKEQDWVPIQADVTLSLGALKPSQVFMPNASYSGRVQWTPLGFPRHRMMEIPWMLVESEDILPVWPRRLDHGHKGLGGKLLVWAGSRGMMGAGHLCTKAAQMAGASMVQWVCPENQLDIAQTLNPEAMALPLPIIDDDLDVESSINVILDRLSWADALVIGPGLGTSPKTLEVMNKILAEIEIPLLLDADALNLLAPLQKDRPVSKGPCIITPHRGEAQRCFGDVPSGGTDLMQWVSKIARDYNLCLHLKGPPSLTATSIGEVFVNGSGNELLSTAGSGDMLSGITGALLAMGILPPHAIFAAAHVHGLCADILKEKHGALGHNTLDLLEQLPTVLNHT